MREQSREDSKTLFPSTRGGPLSADGVQHLLARHVAQARKKCASLHKKRVSPHVLRHAAAMELLQAGVDRAVIALWLGHESVETTQIYLDADLALKEQALSKTNPVKGAPKRFQPDDELLAFLKQLCFGFRTMPHLDVSARGRPRVVRASWPLSFDFAA